MFRMKSEHTCGITAAAADAADVEHVVLVLGVHTNTTVEKGACQTVKWQLLTYSHALHMPIALRAHLQ